MMSRSCQDISGIPETHEVEEKSEILVLQRVSTACCQRVMYVCMCVELGQDAYFAKKTKTG